MSPSLLNTVPSAWRVALIGTLSSLPVAAVINQLPHSEATLGGGIMIIGAFISGVIAVIRATDPGAAGLRTGFIGGVLAVLTFIVTVISTPTGSPIVVWPLSRVVFWVFAVGLGLCIAPVFGLVCGRAGGWVANTVCLQLRTSANTS
ncbi:DUF5518 domain-containing protein [Halorubrum sp. AD140]|uniref:DUF5518 domain-containing protein n=1 Tax=Halorubrum sp. AD140 TaxID=3050073 RepID=UPI002ACCA875|nr:DUF5518 domain-containing protein [Halorubrum sp. AD140]MDZ5810769.1 DUF5518 domain-containing protein [Halorubrum sp. AD140]